MIQIRIVDISLYEVEIRQFLKKQPFGRYLSDRKISESGAISFEWNNLVSYSQKGICAFALNNKSQVIGLIGFHYSDWDSDVFQKKIAFLQYFIVADSKVEYEMLIAANLLEKFHEWCRINRIEAVITKLDTQYFSPILVLQQNRYIFYETITFQSLDVNNIKDNIADGIRYRYAGPNDMDNLKKIALKNTFIKSHFYLDTNFPVEKVALMYSRWIENAIKSEQKIVIVENNDQIAGVFIYDIVDHTLTMNKKFAVWKSAFVDSKFRDKGIGLRLFKATLQSCINNGVNIIDSSLVEKNIVSQSFHNKLGFRLVNTYYTFHKWFD